MSFKLVSYKAIKEARKNVLGDEELKKNLEDWYRHKGALPSGERDMSFNEWLMCRLEDMANCIGDIAFPSRYLPRAISEALRVNAIGDVVALSEAKTARKSFETDVNCYVEEGVVFSDVWLRGANEKEVECEADRIASEMNGAGYSAEVWIDEEDAREATVNAQIDFPIYLCYIKGFKWARANAEK